MTNALTQSERAQLQDCEHKIRESYLNVGKALREIRDSKLYRETHKTFLAYCSERWGYQRASVYRLIDARTIVDHLEESPQIGDFLPDNESQTRPLAPLEPDQQVEAWKEAVDSAPRTDSGEPVITAKHVKAVVEKITPEQATRPGPKPPTQDVIDLREIHKAFNILASLPYSGDKALEKYGYEALGPKADTACDWMQDLIGAHRGQIDISIRLVDGSHFHPTREDIEMWKEAFPEIDVESELRKCAAWNDANPSKRKTHKGIKRHIVAWLGSDRRQLPTNGAGSDDNDGRHRPL